MKNYHLNATKRMLRKPHAQSKGRKGKIVRMSPAYSETIERAIEMYTKEQRNK